ncbi:MAG: 16S rRNA (cytosine(1402)-N(4))-methyltransferase RsmH [Clostridiales bacterium]|nr:16S rRNA (cytosine(1402)-N(4))-methyltransferase RsmH [Clostridiales bacterium]HBM81811.1 16S rRNA (cytosine(1402)-N(4))-methyltransferase [Clostridiaceae bacterium]
MEFLHVPVMLRETIDNLVWKPDGIYVDGTIGGAGHSIEILKRLNDKGRLIGIDRDINAINASYGRLNEYKDRVILVHSKFSNIKNVLKDNGVDKVDGVLLDLGVSSPQLDDAKRGFSYMNNAPLDMRMDSDSSITAGFIVNNYTKEQLKDIITNYGEERWASRISEFIVNEREKHPITTTFELVDIIKKAIPSSARRRGPHPAKRTFQAIRIAVNGELDEISNAIPDIIDVLNKDGRLCIITFHSLEDRIVKNSFKKYENPCTCPPDFPVCVCNKKPVIKVITKKPITPGETELNENPRARSAKLRVAQKL